MEAYKTKYKASQKEVEKLKKLLNKVAENPIHRGEFCVITSLEPIKIKESKGARKQNKDTNTVVYTKDGFKEDKEKM
jgi:hypothetical protein